MMYIEHPFLDTYTMVVLVEEAEISFLLRFQREWMEDFLKRHLKIIQEVVQHGNFKL